MVSGLNELLVKLDKINTSTMREIQQSLLNSVLIVEREAKIKTPVDTGRLQQSITHETEDFETNDPAVVVFTGVEYAKFPEFGTSKQSAQPYMYPALAENKEKILNEIAKAVKEGCGL